MIVNKLNSVYIIILIFITTNIYSQNNFDSTLITNETYQIVKEASKYTDYGTDAAGYGGRPTLSYPSQKKLRAISNKLEFKHLVNHPNLMVRVIAMENVQDMDTFNYLPHIKQSLNHKEEIYGISGCIHFTENYTDFLIQLYLDKNKTKANAKQSIDSLLIMDYVEGCYVREYYSVVNNGKKDSILMQKCYGQGDYIQFRDRLLNSTQPLSEKFYSRIKDLNAIEKNPILIFALSKYKNQNDTMEIINGLKAKEYKDLTFRKNQLFWCYKTICENSNPLFFKHLCNAYKNYSDEKDWRDNGEVFYYYLALLKYEKKETIEFLKQIIIDSKSKNLKTNHRALIWLALNETNRAYFYDFQKTIEITNGDLELSSETIRVLKLYDLY